MALLISPLPPGSSICQRQCRNQNQPLSLSQLSSLAPTCLSLLVAQVPGPSMPLLSPVTSPLTPSVYSPSSVASLHKSSSVIETWATQVVDFPPKSSTFLQESRDTYKPLQGWYFSPQSGSCDSTCMNLRTAFLNTFFW